MKRAARPARVAPASGAAPEVDSVRALAASLLGEELILFPVRHHSPACAAQLRRLFAQCNPSVVLVEGPRSFDTLVPLLTHEQALMPLAVYTYRVCKAKRGEDRRAAYYPFCDYSPELLALREAKARGIPARFIDLDFAEQCAIEPADDDDETGSLLDERHLRRSQYLTDLAQQLGCRDHEELWEHLFEVAALTRTAEDYMAQVATYCHLARVESTAEALTADGTLAREAEMAWHIREALAARAPGAGPVLVVVGGFHAVALPALLKEPPSRPDIARGTVTDEASALIRYSFERLDRLNGYASGMTSPAWHQLLWERGEKQRRGAHDDSDQRLRRDAALTVLFDIAAELRSQHNVPLPVPALQAAYEQSLRLAQLRNRPGPVRDDVLDAVTSCFVKGATDADGQVVLAVARRAFSGKALGKVPPGAATPPLVRDFQWRARRQRLKIDDSEPRRAVLDIYRRGEHRLTSRLLHGLSFLGVPFAVRTAGPDFAHGIGLERLQEHWEYSYSPATEAVLVEASLYGVTLPLAVANRFAAKLDEMEAAGLGRNARGAAESVSEACVLGLHDHLPRILATLRGAIGEDTAFDSVAAAAGLIGLLWESREPLEARDVPELPLLLQAAYERAIYLGRTQRGAPGDGGDYVSALSRLRELVGSEPGRTLDASLFWALLEYWRTQHDLALVRGAAAGLLYGVGQLDEQALAAAVEGHLSGLSQPKEAVAFLRGLLQTAREAAWQQPALLKALNGLLGRWEEAGFVAALPELRLAFAGMTPKETGRIAEAVAQLHGAQDLGPLVRHDLSEAQLRANLVLSQTLREVLNADGLGSWVP